MKYEEVDEVSRAEFESAVGAGDAAAIADGILSLSLHDPDWRWVEAQAVALSTSADVWIRRNVATAFSHLARLHGRLDRDLVIPILQRMRRDRRIRAWANDALEEIEIYVPGAEAA